MRTALIFMGLAVAFTIAVTMNAKAHISSDDMRTFICIEMSSCFLEVYGMQNQTATCKFVREQVGCPMLEESE